MLCSTFPLVIRYYSIFTLIMLLILEATVVKSRIKNMQFLRDMVRPPYQVEVIGLTSPLLLFTQLLSFISPSLLPCPEDYSKDKDEFFPSP